MSSNEYPYRGQNRFQTANPNKQIDSPYDMDSALLTDLKQRGVRAVKVYQLNLGTAGALLIDEPGYHFVIYGRESVTGSVNTTIKVSAFINIQSDDGSTPFPARHARGFSGPYGCLYLKWDAQLSAGIPILADVVLFKSSEQPWIDGESAT